MTVNFTIFESQCVPVTQFLDINPQLQDCGSEIQSGTGICFFVLLGTLTSIRVDTNSLRK